MPERASLLLDGDAVVLAGGKSARMGRDKALLEIEGRPLLDRTVESLRGAFRRVHVSIDPARPYAGLGAPVIPDLVPGRGPLEGVRSSLLRLGRPALFAAVDLPFAPPALARALFLEAAVPGRRGAVPCWRRGLEPALAAYRPELLPEIEALLEAGQGALHRLARLPGVAVLDLEDAEVRRRVFGGPGPPLERLFTNLNSPADLPEPAPAGPDLEPAPE